MYHRTNKLTLRILLLAVFYFILAESASNELLSPMGAACPGDVLMYTCTIVGSGNTIWSGSAFDCSTKMNEIILRHSQFASPGTTGNCNGGAIRTQSIGVTNSNCYSSQLNVTVTSAMHGKTIQCAHSSDRVETVGVATLSIATAPPANVRLYEIRPEELTFNWRASTNRTYAIDSDCGNCPNMTNTPMVTCRGLTLSTTPTMCTFSVQSIACGTIGSSVSIMVNLAVPAAPDVTIIPQYSMLRSLTGIIVHLQQNVTPSDTISGSITSYNIYYAGNLVNNVSACMNNTCTYTVNISCSTDGGDVKVASVNKVGEGPQSEAAIIECNNQFVSVDYDPETTTITCTFENKLDISVKSCRVEYGTCGQEAYVTEGNSTNGPIILLLNSSGTNPENCYIVTASNGTFTVSVKEEFMTASSGGTMSANKIVIIIIIIIVIMIAVVGIVITVIAFIVVLLQVRHRHPHGDQEKNETLNELQSLTVTTKEDEFQDIDLYVISSMQFKMTQLPKDLGVAKLKSRYGEYTFVEYDQEEEGRENIIDVILRRKDDGQLSSGRDTKSYIGQKQEDYQVFVLISQLSSRKVICQGKLILYQNPDQMKQRSFGVLHVDEDTTVSELLSEKKLELENKTIFRQFPPNGIDLEYYRDVLKVPSSKRKLLKQLSKSPKEELILNKSDTGIRMFYQLKLSAPGSNVKPRGDPESYYIQVTNEDSYCSLGSGSFVLVYKDPDEHTAV